MSGGPGVGEVIGAHNKKNSSKTMRSLMIAAATALLGSPDGGVLASQRSRENVCVERIVVDAR